MSDKSGTVYSNIPIPDPSFITSQEIAKAKTELREEFKTALASQTELLVTSGVGRYEKSTIRIESIEKAFHVFEENLNRVPSHLDREIARLDVLFNEKLQGLADRLQEFHNFASILRDNANKAIDSAFVSSEKISANQRLAFEQQIAKSEAAITKEIDAIKVLIDSMREGFNSQITNLTDRLNRDTGAVYGVREAKTATNLAGTAIGTYMAGGAAIVAVIVSIFVGVHQMSANTSGTDTRRVDDLIAQLSQSDRQATARMDALSARLNQLSGLTPKP